MNGRGRRSRKRIRAKHAVQQGRFRGRCIDSGNLQIKNSRYSIDFKVDGNRIDAHRIVKMMGINVNNINDEGWDLFGWLNDENIEDVTDLVWYAQN